MVAQRGNRSRGKLLCRGLCPCGATPLLHARSVDAPALCSAAPGSAAVSSSGGCHAARLFGRGRDRPSRVLSGAGKRTRPGAPLRSDRRIPSCIPCGSAVDLVPFTEQPSQVLRGRSRSHSRRPYHSFRRRTVVGSPYSRFAPGGPHAVVSPLFTRGRPEGRYRGRIGYRMAQPFAPSQLLVFAGKLVLCRKDHRIP